MGRLLYPVYLLVAIGLIAYVFFYRPRVAEIREKVGLLAQEGDPWELELVGPRHVSPELMRLLGKATTEKESSFIHFDRAKAEGVVRVCAFGDSFAYGDEVAEDLDYPSLLGRLFENAGAENVEVINFGIGGFGFHQTYIMWDRLGRDFDCDFRLLGPRGFQPIRDTTFGYIHHWTPYYLHARYVLDGDDLRLVELEGETYGERFDHHFRFLTPWRYLRYDRKPPMFLKALIPRDRELANPFYYDPRPMEEEAFDTYRILLSKMASEGGPLVVGHYLPEIVDLAREVDSENLTAFDVQEKLSFPYRAPLFHDGPLGNLLVAEQFFAVLTGSTEGSLTVVEARDLEEDPREEITAAAPRHGVETFHRLAIETEGVAVGHFVIGSFGGGSPTDVAGLLAFQPEGGGLLDACFAPLDFVLEPGSPLTLLRGAEGAGERFTLGRVELLDPRINLGVVEIEGLENPRAVRAVTPPFFPGNAVAPLSQLPVGQIRFEIDGRLVMRGQRGQRGVLDGFYLSPETGRCRILRATETGFLDPAELAEGGRFDLVFEHWQAGEGRTPIAAWERAELELLPPPEPPRQILAFTPEGRAVLEPRP